MQNIELEHIQRLVVNGYGHFPHAAYLPLRVVDGRAARSWLAARIETIGCALAREREHERARVAAQRSGSASANGADPAAGAVGSETKPSSKGANKVVKSVDSQRAAPSCDTGLRRTSIAFSYDGLGRLGMDTQRDEVSAGFLPEFRGGMVGESHRTRALGDVGPSAPESWRWGNARAPVHVLWMLFAATEADREAWLESELAGLTGLELVDEPVRCALSPDGTEPFGFRDGLSQPVVEGSRTSRAGKTSESHLDPVRAGEFVLGYLNTFERIPVSPTLPASLDPGDCLPDTGLEQPRLRDFGRNGTYLVVRQLAQDVEGFHRQSAEQARKHPELGDARDIEARMVGRRHDGTPLAPRALGRRIPPTENDFGYWQTDRQGYRCPVGAHVRRSNPRDSLANPALGVPPERARQLANHHRILRRGREYRRADGERGLLFICLQANIERQFEFAQQSWIRGERFGGLAREQDPIAGGPTQTASVAGDRFSVQRPFADHTLTGLAHYVTVKAGGYFFLPSLPALRYLASLT